LTVFDYPAIAVGVAVFDLVGGSGYPKQEAFREGLGVAGAALAARPVVVAAGTWRRVGRFMMLLII
jgi:hypothetical protein